MITWATWTLCLLSLGVVLKIIYIGIGVYPRQVSRAVDAINIVIAGIIIVWGFAVLY